MLTRRLTLGSARTRRLKLKHQAAAGAHRQRGCGVLLKTPRCAYDDRSAHTYSNWENNELINVANFQFFFFCSVTINTVPAEVLLQLKVPGA